MPSKCTRCGNEDNYNFAINNGLCNSCIASEIESPKSTFCTFRDEVKIDELTYLIQICVTALDGETIDEFTAIRVVGKFKRILDADFEAERE